jgi:hypothetical protein
MDVKEEVNRLLSFVGGTIRCALGKEVRSETLLQLHKVMAHPSLLYGSCKTWTHRADQIRIEAAEMQFLTWVAGYAPLDRRRSEEI